LNSGSFYSQNQVARETTVPAFFCPTRRPPMITPPPGDAPDSGTTPATGALADYACSIGTSPDGDYWWTGPNPNTGAPNTPCNGVFRLDNNWGPIRTPTYVGGYKFKEITDGLSNTICIGEKHVPITKFGDLSSHDGAAYNG